VDEGPGQVGMYGHQSAPGIVRKAVFKMLPNGTTILQGVSARLRISA
jgi:hypothetical protein